MDNRIGFAALWFVAGVLVTVLVSGSGIGQRGPGMMGGMWGNGRGGQAGQVDRHFIEQMIPHHDDAIAMAGIALRRAEHQEVKDLAAAIIAAQEKENETMAGWYREWFGQEEVPKNFAGMGHGMMHGDSGPEIAADLEKAEPFDRAFIEEMVPHHQMAIMMAQMLERTTDREEMRGLARDIIKAQSDEIGKMSEWYGSWYGQ